MWCAGCKADVAVEVSPDTERALCTTCGRELLTSVGNKDRQSASFHAIDAGISESVRSKSTPPRSVADARQLLERWTRENLLDPVESKSGSTKIAPEPTVSKSSTSTVSNVSNSLTDSGSNSAASEKINPAAITRVVNDESISAAPKIAVDSPVETVMELAHKANLPKLLVETPPKPAAVSSGDIAPTETTKKPSSTRMAKSVAVIDKAFAEQKIMLDDDRSVAVEASPVASPTGASLDEVAASETGKSRFRIDRSHPGPGEQQPEFAPDAAHETPFERQIPASAAENRAASSLGHMPESTSHRRFHGAHPPLAGVHFDVQSLIQAGNESPRQSTQTIFGQMLAYLGVGVLTLGTGCVLWGYFGAAQYSHLAPTGWLITTAGQMLLFLGVVTLIAGGLEQTNSLVNTRLEHWERKWMEINGHIYRADPPTSQPMGQGPHISVGAFQPPGTIPRSSTVTRTSADA